MHWGLRPTDLCLNILFQFSSIAGLLTQRRPESDLRAIHVSLGCDTCKERACLKTTATEHPLSSHLTARGREAEGASTLRVGRSKAPRSHTVTIPVSPLLLHRNELTTRTSTDFSVPGLAGYSDEITWLLAVRSLPPRHDPDILSERRKRPLIKVNYLGNLNRASGHIWMLSS